MHSEKESIFQIYANGSKNREKWLGKSDNRAIYLRSHPLDADSAATERRMIMDKCTGKRCPMQVGYKVNECNYKDCPYRTEPITNADRIRAMSDENLAWELMLWRCEAIAKYHGIESQYPDTHSKILDWLQQPAE